MSGAAETWENLSAGMREFVCRRSGLKTTYMCDWDDIPTLDQHEIKAFAWRFIRLAVQLGGLI